MKLIGVISEGKFDHLDLSGCDCRGTWFSRCDMTGMIAIGANFQGARFITCIVKNAILENCNLSKADLRNSSFENSILRGADLHGANVCGTQFINTDLHQSRLDELLFNEETDFSGSILDPKLPLPPVDIEAVQRAFGTTDERIEAFVHKTFIKKRRGEGPELQAPLFSCDLGTRSHPGYPLVPNRRNERTMQEHVLVQVSLSELLNADGRWRARRIVLKEAANRATIKAERKTTLPSILT